MNTVGSNSKKITSEESAKRNIGFFDYYIRTILKKKNQNPQYFTFEKGNRITILTSDDLDKNNLLLYKSENSLTPLENVGVGKFILEKDMGNRDFVFIERNGIRLKTEYQAVEWEITDIKPENVNPEEVDSALDNIYYAFNYKYPNSNETVKKIRFERNNSSVYVAGGYPRQNRLCAFPFDYPIKMQKKAIDAFLNHAQEHNKPIIKILGNYDDNEWPDFYMGEPESYEFLTQPDNPAQYSQKNAVKQALYTPDFSILEGPPGSGKTTVLLETIVQAIKQGKRILLVASTHVAVDNILERLEEKKCLDKYGIFPIRIGDEDNVNPKLNKYRLSEVAETERERLLTFYRSIPKEKRTEAQKEMIGLISGRNSLKSLENLVIDSSNLVCGTTIGILQAPMIHDSNRSIPQPLFDIMILDEASKTTFTEFLVSALYAKKFVISGDTKQLAPFTDEENIEKCMVSFLPDETDRRICKAVFDIGNEIIRNHYKKCDIARIIVCPEDTNFNDYSDKIQKQIEWFRENRDIEDKIVFKAIQDPSELESDRECYLAISSNLLLVTQPVLVKLAPILPPVFSLQPYPYIKEDIVKNQDSRRKALHYANDEDDNSSWESEISWRFCRKFELHKTIYSKSRERYIREIEDLYPKWNHNDEETKNNKSFEEIESAALGSILELMETGFTSTNPTNKGFILADGLEVKEGGKHWDRRHTLLEYQWRMHPDIARFPAKEFYNNTALKTDPIMEIKREFDYQPGSRVIWIDTRHSDICKNRNEYEAEKIIEKLDGFLSWAIHNPKDGGWTVSLLTFYLSQRDLLETMFRNVIKEKYGFNGKHSHFNKPGIQISIATVDRFQGQEADVVYLSFVRSNGNNPKRKSHIGFLDSANRMNVALTRAKYQLYLFGSLNNFGKTGDEMPAWLSKLAIETPQESTPIHY